MIYHGAFTAGAFCRPLEIKVITCIAQANAVCLQRWTTFVVDNAFYVIVSFFLQHSSLVSLSSLRECLNSKSLNLFEFLNGSKPRAAVLFLSLIFLHQGKPSFSFCTLLSAQ